MFYSVLLRFIFVFNMKTHARNAKNKNKTEYIKNHHIHHETFVMLNCLIVLFCVEFE